jgi:hypothetical protein
MRWYEPETQIMLMRFTMPRLFNIAHLQNQRKTALLCMNASQTRAGGRQVLTGGRLWLAMDFGGRFPKLLIQVRVSVNRISN